MGPAFANLLEIGGERTHEKRPDIEVRPFLQFFLLEAKSGDQTIYASLRYNYIISKQGKESYGSFPYFQL